MTAHSERKTFNSSSSAGQSQCLEHGWQHSICPSPARSHDHSRNLGCRAVLQNSQGICRSTAAKYFSWFVFHQRCISRCVLSTLEEMYLNAHSVYLIKDVSRCVFFLLHLTISSVCILMILLNVYLNLYSVKDVSHCVLQFSPKVVTGGIGA